MLPTLLLLLLAADGGAPAESGMLCLPPATWSYPKASMTPEQVDEARVLEGPKALPYSVQVDDREPVDVTTRAVRVDGLDVAVKHRVRVFGKGGTWVDFKFSFQDKNGLRQALNYSPAYGSWGMRKAGKKECSGR